MYYQAKEFTAKDNLKVVLKTPEVTEAADLLEFIRRVADQTPFLLSSSEDFNFPVEKEEAFLKNIDLSKYSSAYSSPNCFEIAPKGVNKAKAIERLANILSCDNSQILSFGDMPNDLPMLLNSTGVVMENASDEMKSQVTLHTSRVDDKGVYEFLHNNQLI